MELLVTYSAISLGAVENRFS